MSVELDTVKPIFIVGAPRSGTSLLRAMLNRHPAIGLCDETFYFYYVYRRQRAFGDLHDPDNRRRLITEYLQTDRIQRLHLNLPVLAERLMEEGNSYEMFFATLITCFAETHGKVRPGEKTPHHALVTDLLLTWYPNGKIIHIVRDPRDVVASLRRMPWARRSAVASARLWARLTAAAERSRDQPRYRLVHYERLVADPEEELQRLCAFLEEPYDAAMIQTDGSAGTHQEWWFRRAQQQLTQQRVGTWRQELPDNYVRLVEWTAGATMAAVGYDRSQADPSPLLKMRGLLHGLTDTTQEKISRLPALWYHWIRPTALRAEESWIDRGKTSPKGSSSPRYRPLRDL